MYTSIYSKDLVELWKSLELSSRIRFVCWRKEYAEFKADWMPEESIDNWSSSFSPSVGPFVRGLKYPNKNLYCVRRKKVLRFRDHCLLVCLFVCAVNEAAALALRATSFKAKWTRDNRQSMLILKERCESFDATNSARHHCQHITDIML